MKIHPKHVTEVTDLVSEFVSAHFQEVEEYAKHVSPERLRWDVFRKAVPQHLISQIYGYANDEHIDTLLRRIFSHAR